MIKRNLKIIKRNTELWESIKDFPGYIISNMGRVKSVNRSIICSDGVIRFYKSRIRKSSLNFHGYYHLNLSKKGKVKKLNIHALVINHFGKKKPSPKHECNHKDGDKRNNWNTNFEWMTRKENIEHAYDLGLVPINFGEKNGYSKHTQKDVVKIRKMYATGKYRQIELAKMFNVGQSNISDITRYQLWSVV